MCWLTGPGLYATWTQTVMWTSTHRSWQMRSAGTLQNTRRPLIGCCAWTQRTSAKRAMDAGCGWLAPPVTASPTTCSIGVYVNPLHRQNASVPGIDRIGQVAGNAPRPSEPVRLKTANKNRHSHTILPLWNWPNALKRRKKLLHIWPDSPIGGAADDGLLRTVWSGGIWCDCQAATRVAAGKSVQHLKQSIRCHDAPSQYAA